MKRGGTSSNSPLTIVEAVETLSSIADIDPDRDIGVAQPHEFVVQGKSINYQTIHWLYEDDADTTIEVIKNTFRVVLRYLRNFYRKEYGYLTDARTLEGIKTIMVLVGEAAKKLDKITKIFHGAQMASVTDLYEFRQLQDFYQKRIAKKIDEGTLGKWVLALTKEAPKPEDSKVVLRGRDKDKNRVFVDLDAVKKDEEYELFFVRREDGTRFYDPRLLRNVRLVCDFGEYFGEYKGDDPLGKVNVWQDWIYQLTAKSILKIGSVYVDEFYKRFAEQKNLPMVRGVNYTLMALMMTANPRNLRRNRPVKSCKSYFRDFLNFLRATMGSTEYHKLITYPPGQDDRAGWCTMSVIHSLCEGLFVRGRGFSEMAPIVADTVDSARRVVQVKGETDDPMSTAWWDVLYEDYSAVLELFKRHPNGPLYKVLEILKEDQHQYFDTLFQHNIPHLWYTVFWGDHAVRHARLPAPTRQDFINKAVVSEEFKGLLRGYQNAGKGCHLLINLQNRTSWLDRARCEALEQLQQRGEFQQYLRVVTFDSHTDFYHQLAPYHDLNRASEFLGTFFETLMQTDTGYFFPAKIHHEFFPSFVQQLLKGIHKLFFVERNVLHRRERLDFIELTHLFLSLKLIESTGAESFSFSCKDAVDIGSGMSALLYGFLKLCETEQMTAKQLDQLYLMLYGPPMIVRERAMLPERFQRTAGALKKAATVCDELGYETFLQELELSLGKLYHRRIFQSEVLTPESVQIVY